MKLVSTITSLSLNRILGYGSQIILCYCIVYSWGGCGYWTALFFEENDETISVNSDRYTSRCRTHSSDLNFDSDGFLCLQLGERIYSTTTSRTRHFSLWRRLLTSRLTFKFAIFLYEYLKCRLYINKPRTLRELKETIQQEVKSHSSCLSTQYATLG